MRKTKNLSNSDIQNVYFKWEQSADSRWKHDLFEKLFFVVENKVKKSKKKIPREDFRQELSLALWRAIKTFDCHKNFDFYRWLTWHLSGCTRNFCKHNAVDNSINLLVSGTFKREVPRQETLLLLNEILGTNAILFDREKGVILKYFLEGRTLKEIGQELDLSPERVRQIRDTGLEKIQEIV